MCVLLFILVLFMTESTSVCVKNRIKLWSPIKCEAGRTFFTRLSTVANITEDVNQPYLFPWLTELKIVLPEQVTFCSGALINDKYVLTAQNCFLPPVQVHHVTLHMGFYNGYGKDVSEIFQPRILDRKAEQIIPYPYYNPQDSRTAANNLALVKMNEPVQYSKTIYPIQLPAPGDKFMDYANQLAENVEWSFLPNYGTQSSKKFKDTIVKILSAQQCANFNHNYKSIVTPEVLCSINIKKRTKPCKQTELYQENGGLLMLTKSQRTYNITILVGLTAWEPPKPSHCQDLPPPRLYIRIVDKLQWIKANTRDASYCRY